MFAALDRPYKECAAEDTVARIQGILDRHDLLPTETGHTNPFPEIFSVSVQLDPSKGGFKAHGKGRTAAYARASAYAEFIERLQNGLYASYSRTMLATLHERFDFHYAPDEALLSKDAFLRLPEPILSDLIRWTGEHRDDFIDAYFQRLEAHNADGTVGVPFFCSQTREQVHLPLNLLLMAVGSNGMAAGNSVHEATYQAICELMERWGAARVFYGRMTPPDVPDAYLRQFEQEYALMRTLEASGKYQVVVKDFSAGTGIPVIGMIIRNRSNNTYRLNVGCDTSLQVALSRCLTEIMQGIPDEATFDACMLQVPTEELECFRTEEETALNMRQAIFAQFTRDNTGLFPISLFGETPSYAFDPQAFRTRTSYAEEVSRLIDLFHGLGRAVYVRPVGYLGFPSVFIYVPEVSVMGRKNAPAIRRHSTFEMIAWDQVEEPICRIDQLAPEELLHVATALKSLPQQLPVTDLLSLKLKDGSVWSQIPVSFLRTQLYYRVGRFADASSAFSEFLASRSDDNPYYRGIDHYLKLRAKDISATDACGQLRGLGLPQETVDQVCRDLADPALVFRHVRLPACPRCDACAINDDCLTEALLRVSHRVYPAMREYRPESPFS